ncbi:multicopper oxidase-domain-containing protein [Halteromyces radiatus]|uniref:multicopper oxidase-domain-containing protein n=1 Tax=Halteromyces radiatus TaxID=101107 RepID=UPI00221F7A72|nr:multicopper oxidase-domain-containing protein [Halteromyces radiatus]KAI8099879.1 multicopper oxidase-domain-containing protein [Halteromyces radiatus]
MGFFSIPFLPLLLVFITVSPLYVFAELKKYEWTISQRALDPDCFGTSYPALVVNGQFPGPAIRVTEGDDVEIKVHNECNEPTSIHFHGIRQYGSVESDGVPDVTQKAILPGHSYTYQFRAIGQIGTYFYHAHVGTQDDTVQGAFIIDSIDESIVNPSELILPKDNPQFRNANTSTYTHHEGPYGYDDEFTIELTEWWHQPPLLRADYYLGTQYTFDPAADSILLNGVTVFQNATVEERQNCPNHTTIDVLPNSTYRLRLIGGTTFHTYGFAIKDHELTIIEVDGELIEAYTTDHLEISPGQRFSVLIHTSAMEETSEDEDDDEPIFAIATSYRYRANATGHTDNGFGYLQYVLPSSQPDDDKSRSHPLDARSNIPSSHSLQKRAEVDDEHDDGKLDDDTADVSAAASPDDGKLDDDTGDVSAAASPDDDVDEDDPDAVDEAKRNAKLVRHPKPPKPTHMDFPSIPDPGNSRDWIWPNLKPLYGSALLEGEPDRTLKMRSWAITLPDNTTRYLINGRLAPMISDMQESQHSYLEAKLEYDGFEPIVGTYPIQLNETVDIVLQNVQSGQNCVYHPWHTHGHSHYIIATGEGEYIHELDKDKRNYPHSILRDVSPVYPGQVDPNTQGCGWTKIRLHADNPGLWAVHCHITAHMLLGKMFLLEEAVEYMHAYRMYM